MFIFLGIMMSFIQICEQRINSIISLKQLCVWKQRFTFESVVCGYRISANSCRDNYSFFETWLRQLFKGDNYSKEETIVFS